MAELKTKPNSGSVQDFLAAIADERKRQDCIQIMGIMQAETGEQPQMWGDAIVGFGRYHYRYASGREGDWFLTGFSPRKQDLTLYILSGFDLYADLLARLGKFKLSKSCLYIKKLADVDQDVLRVLVRRSAEHMRTTNSAENPTSAAGGE